MQKNIIKFGFLHAGATTAYIALLVLSIHYAVSFFESRGAEETILMPMVMLLLFVISAAITGFAVFGRPVMWYMDGKKKEAIALLAWTLGALMFFAMLFVAVLLAWL
ncbi:MAG: hypothetical protein Q7S28_04120 [bacterium]|nr:hypothetical protein [bacterium]